MNPDDTDAESYVQEGELRSVERALFKLETNLGYYDRGDLGLACLELDRLKEYVFAVIVENNFDSTNLDDYVNRIDNLIKKADSWFWPPKPQALTKSAFKK